MKVAPVRSVRIVRDQITRVSKGYAYVNFNTEQHRDAGKRILVSRRTVLCARDVKCLVNMSSTLAEVYAAMVA